MDKVNVLTWSRIERCTVLQSAYLFLDLEPQPGGFKAAPESVKCMSKQIFWSLVFYFEGQTKLAEEQALIDSKLQRIVNFFLKMETIGEDIFQEKKRIKRVARIYKKMVLKIPAFPAYTIRFFLLIDSFINWKKIEVSQLILLPIALEMFTEENDPRFPAFLKPLTSTTPIKSREAFKEKKDVVTEQTYLSVIKSLLSLVLHETDENGKPLCPVKTQNDLIAHITDQHGLTLRGVSDRNLRKVFAAANNHGT